MNKKDELTNKLFFKKYIILKKIGKGSFGMVYLGKIINSNNFVAVKFEPKNQTDLILERESYLLYLIHLSISRFVYRAVLWLSFAWLIPGRQC